MRIMYELLDGEIGFNNIDYFNIVGIDKTVTFGNDRYNISILLTDVREMVIVERQNNKELLSHKIVEKETE